MAVESRIHVVPQNLEEVRHLRQELQELKDAAVRNQQEMQHQEERH
jgi:hypothetical protein